MNQQARSHLSSLICLRLPTADPDAVYAVIIRLDVTDGGLSRFARRLATSTDWPTIPLSGRISHQILTALQQAGIVEHLPGCGHCRRPMVLVYDGPLGLTCRPCGPRNLDGSEGRCRTPTRECPAGRHHMPRGSNDCPHCIDEQQHTMLLDAAVALGADPHTANDAISSLLQTAKARQVVTAWLRSGGSLANPADGPPLAQRLRTELAARVPGIDPTRCPRCQQQRPRLVRGREGLVCPGCYAQERADTCVSCRRRRRVSWRDEDGRAWCATCRRRHPDTLAPCIRCGATKPVAVRTDAGPIGDCCYRTREHECVGCGQHRPVWAWRDGEPRCSSCYQATLERCGNCGEQRRLARQRTRGRHGWCVTCVELPLIHASDASEMSTIDSTAALVAPAKTCSACGKNRRVTYLPDGPRCSTCRGVAMRRREQCNRCGQHRRVFFDPGVCADCLGIDIGSVCSTCGAEDNLYAAGNCAACELRSRVHQLFEEAGEPGRILAERLAVSTRPRSVLHWLAHNTVPHLLLDVLHGGRTPTHDDLDAIAVPTKDQNSQNGQHPNHRQVHTARALLVSAGVLPPRHELSHRYQAWAHRTLSSVVPAADRWTAQRFHRQRLLPTVENSCRKGKATEGTIRGAQGKLRAAIALLDWARTHGGLSSLRRTDIDEWLAGPSTRHTARDFLVWAIRNKLLELPVNAIPKRHNEGPSVAEDHDVRVDIARRLLHEPGYQAHVRVAGLLVTIYGQHLSRIVQLTRAHVDDAGSHVRIKLGTEWLVLPGPLDQHVRTLLASPPGRQTASHEQSQWLFPGQTPGSHMTEAGLRYHFIAHGIRARAMRNTSMFQLAATLQPVTLQHLLGLHSNTAAQWVNRAGGVYANYWEQFLDDDEESDDTGLLDLESHSLDDTHDDDPLDLLEELGL